MMSAIFDGVVQFLQNNLSTELATVIISMLPVVELRGGIPFAIAMGIDWWWAVVLGVIGNMIPIPFVIWFIRPILNSLKKRKVFAEIVAWQERKMEANSKKVEKYSILGLLLFVAIPLPGTGAWTGAMLADFLNMKMSHAVLSICGGVLCAAVLVAIASMGVAAGLEWIL